MSSKNEQSEVKVKCWKDMSDEERAAVLAHIESRKDAYRRAKIRAEEARFGKRK